MINVFHFLMRSISRLSEIPVHERLDRDAMDIKKAVQKREEVRLSAELEGLTFHPHVSEKSLVIARRKESIAHESDDGTMSVAPHDIFEKLNSSHTVASLGGGIHDEPNMSSLHCSGTLDK